MDYAIETENLTKNFGSLTAVNKLNLKVQKKHYTWFSWSKRGWKNNHHKNPSRLTEAQ
jgi:hypothetical protein